MHKFCLDCIQRRKRRSTNNHLSLMADGPPPTDGPLLTPLGEPWPGSDPPADGTRRPNDADGDRPGSSRSGFMFMRRKRDEITRDMAT